MLTARLGMRMDQRRRWGRRQGVRSVRSPRQQPRGSPSRWVAPILGVISLALAAAAGTLMFLSDSSPQDNAAASKPVATTDTPAQGGPPPTRNREWSPAVAVRRPPTQVASPGEEPGQQESTNDSQGAEPLLDEDALVEHGLRALITDEERAGQLLLVGWAGNSAEQARRTLQELRPGGIVFIENARLASEASAINRALLRMSGEYGMPPPLITMDHEGGTVQRITDAANVGTNAAFGARRPSDRAACERGLTHARQLRSMGFTMNLAPVLDVNNNPANPVIGSRSYGADAELVARLGSAYVRGLQGGGIAAVGKHFPGHGNTSVDSHLELPILPQTEAQLEQVELVPFRRVIEPPTNIAGIMSAHIVFPALDPSRTPATLSRPIMTGLLREKLGFDGLVLTDDLAAMKAITDHYSPGQAAVRAVKAGVDLLIIGGGLARQRESRDALLSALASGELERERFDEAVRHVLQTKARFGLLGGPEPPEAACE